MDEVSETALEKGCQEDVLIMDFSKAFDKVSHSLLVHKLRQYGIPGRVNRWIENFLSDRKQAVVVNGSAEISVRASGIRCPTMFRPWAEPVLALDKLMTYQSD